MAEKVVDPRTGETFEYAREGDIYSVRYYDGCAGCERYKAKGETFFPPHVPSTYCESGGRNHCTCGTCF